MSVDQADDLLTVKEVASLLKVSPVTIKRYLKQGYLPAYHVGPRAIRIRREDLRRLLTKADAREVAMKLEQQRFPSPGEEELARRQALMATILARRETRRIAPMTSAELVHLSRKESTWYGAGR